MAAAADDVGVQRHPGRGRDGERHPSQRQRKSIGTNTSWVGMAAPVPISNSTFASTAYTATKNVSHNGKLAGVEVAGRQSRDGGEERDPERD